jgi:hypothetical protein
MLTDIRKRQCETCGEMFRPRYPTQRWCRAWCRAQGKASEARAARRSWCEAGKLKETEEQRAAWQRRRKADPRVEVLRSKIDGRAIVEALKLRTAQG